MGHTRNNSEAKIPIPPNEEFYLPSMQILWRSLMCLFDEVISSYNQVFLSRKGAGVRVDIETTIKDKVYQLYQNWKYQEVGYNTIWKYLERSHFRGTPPSLEPDVGLRFQSFRKRRRTVSCKSDKHASGMLPLLIKVLWFHSTIWFMERPKWIWKRLRSHSRTW